MTTMSSPYSMTYMFLPISPTPPSGMIRSGVSPGSGVGAGVRLGIRPPLRRGSARRRRDRSGSWWVPRRRPGRRTERHRSLPGRRRRGCRAVGARLRAVPPRACVAQDPRQPGDVVVALALDLGAAERGRGVVERVCERVAGAGAGGATTAVPWIWVMRSPGRKWAIEKRPSVTTTAGSRTSSWRCRYGAQAAISSGSGSRLPGRPALDDVGDEHLARDASRGSRAASPGGRRRGPRTAGPAGPRSGPGPRRRT